MKFLKTNKKKAMNIKSKHEPTLICMILREGKDTEES